MKERCSAGDMPRPHLDSKGDMKGEKEEHLSSALHLPEDRPTYATPPATMSTKVQKLMTQPINLMFRFLQNQVNTRIEGRIMGFDEYMNLVLDDAEELDVKNLKRTPLGRILLKGDTITLMMSVDGAN
ncbi:hypothetical protein BBJ28_00000782 [Nothophytophthora sp. Chile5]|nr:hypothetical protein BBJ28_00000782 [Nothophytophthora sp. Chile5]